MTHPLQELLDNLQMRDKSQVDSMTDFYGNIPSIDARLGLALGRATDAMIAIAVLAKYIMDKDREK